MHGTHPVRGRLTDHLMTGVSTRAMLLCGCLALGGGVLLSAPTARAANDALTPGSGDTEIEGIDTWDLNAAQGAADANLNFDNGGGSNFLTIRNSGTNNQTASVGTIAVIDNNGTHKIVLGDPNQSTSNVLIVNGVVSGDVATDDNDLDLEIRGGRDGNSNTVEFRSNVNTGFGVIQFKDGTINGTGRAIARFTGTGQTVNAKFIGEGEGHVIVGNGVDPASVTFSGGFIGRLEDDTGLTALNDDDPVGLFQVLPNATATVTTDLFAGRDLASDPDDNPDEVAIDIDGTLILDGSTAAFPVIASGQVDFDGTVTVTGPNSLTITGVQNQNSAGTPIAVDGTLTTLLSTAGATLTIECAETTYILSFEFEGANPVACDNPVTIGANTNTTLNVGNQIVLRGGALPDIRGMSNTNRVAGGPVTIGGAGTTTRIVINRSATFDPTTTAVIDATAVPVTIHEGGTITVSLGTNTGPAYVVSDKIVVIDSSTQVQGSASGPTTYSALIANGTIVLVDTATLDLVHDTTSNVQQDLVITFAVEETVPEPVEQAMTATTSAEVVIDCAGNARTLAAGSAAAGDSEAFSALACLTSQEEVETASEQLTPDPHGGGTVALMSVTTQTNTVIGFRLASLRENTLYAERAPLGLAAGDDGALRHAVWAKPYTNHVQQGERGGVAGFDAFTWGILGGVDTEFLPGAIDGARAGISIGYADTHVFGSGAADSENRIDSYQVALYGDYTTDRYYVEGILAFSWNEVATRRRITFGGLDRTAEGRYAARQYAARFDAGLPIRVGDGPVVTPTAGFQYIQVESDAYTETGAGNLNLAVDQDTLRQALGMVGAKVHTDLDVLDGRLRPELRGTLLYDFASDEAVSTATFTAGGASFQTTGADVAELGGAIGLGLGFTSDDQRWTVSADYEATLKDDFRGHTGMVQATLRF